MATVLSDADLAVESLSGTIEESYASKLRREVFQIEVIQQEVEA